MTQCPNSQPAHEIKRGLTSPFKDNDLLVYTKEISVYVKGPIQNLGEIIILLPFFAKNEKMCSYLRLQKIFLLLTD